MPFGDDDYKDKVIAMNEYQLEAEKKMLNTRLAGSTTKAGVSLGLSVICPLLLFSTAYSAARTADAACKLDIVNAVMRAKNCYKDSRCRDFALGAGITCATAGIAHGASTLAHHAIADLHYHHPTPQHEEWICEAVEHGAKEGSDTLIYRGVRPDGGSDYDPAKPARKRCDECYCVSSSSLSKASVYLWASHANMLVVADDEPELVSLYRLCRLRPLHPVLDSRPRSFGQARFLSADKLSVCTEAS